MQPDRDDIAADFLKDIGVHEFTTHSTLVILLTTEYRKGLERAAQVADQTDANATDIGAAIREEARNA